MKAGVLRVLAILFFALSACGLARAEGGAVVIAVTDGGPDVHPGDEIGNADILEIPDGASVTLIRQDGEVLHIEGPHDGPLDLGEVEEGADGDWGAVSIFLTGPDGQSTALGAARRPEAGADIPGQPTVWQVSVDSSGPRCSPVDHVELWRRAADEAVTVSARNQNGRLGALEWKAGEHSLVLPDSLQVSEGQLIVSLGDGVRKLDIVPVSQDVMQSRPGELLTWLIEHKCHRQARSLIDALHASSSGRVVAE
ncbi:MAG: hypothetical protein C0606_17080 [Hyphomicrobiales bacterium]|nr:MAG: hypothetical protein C0606_17080 [Hyphomicrobiales bacterium]